jgi:hypothetical protein
MARKQPVIAFGPTSTLPSWRWVGQDTARELGRYFDVRIYDSFGHIEDCDVIFIVKQTPPREFVKAAKRNQIRLVYLPIDVYASRKQILLDAFLLQEYDLVLSHCERLVPLLQPYCADVRYIDHHAKYSLAEMAGYKQAGYVLWVGGCQYLPYLLHWLKDHPLDAEVRILTDIGNPQAVERANRLAGRLLPGLELQPDDTLVRGHRIYSWSESLQLQMMSECKVALDIKGERDFSQQHKPATKAQKFIASGIPFAVNPESYSYEYFSNRGIELATPDETGMWFSRQYWQDTQSWGRDLKLKTSIGTIGLQYRDWADQLLARKKISTRGKVV